jgi:hypothetical protein
MKFSDALDRNLEDIKRPPNLPVGHYVWQVNKLPEHDEFDSARTGTSFERVTFQMTCVEARDDVDPDELGDFGNVQGALNRKSFLFSTDEDDKAAFERSMFNLRRFLGHLGVDESLSISEALSASVGAQCVGEITHRADPNDPEIIYAEIGRTAEV